MARPHYSSFDEAEKSIIDILYLLQDHPPADSSGFVIPIGDIEGALSDIEDVVDMQYRKLLKLEDRLADLEVGNDELTDERDDLQGQVAVLEDRLERLEG